MNGYGFAFNRWMYGMILSWRWPFYDGCEACQRQCLEAWQRMNPRQQDRDNAGLSEVQGFGDEGKDSGSAPRSR